MRHKPTLVALALVFALVSSAKAEDWKKFVEQLADVLASERFCRLKYDQKAIEALISERVAPENLEFVGRLTLYTQLKQSELKLMTKSHRTAHCFTIKRSAKHYKLVK